MRKEYRRELLRYDKVQQKEQTERIENVNGNLYAILFNAKESNEKIPFSKDLFLVYDLIIKAKVPDSNIFALEGNGNTSNKFVKFSATEENLEKVVSIIKQKAKPEDKLFIYLTNHGYRLDEKSMVHTFDGNLWEDDYEKIMKDLPVNFAVHYFSQCHSGGFAERIGFNNNIGISNASKKEEANGFEGVGCTFTQYLFPKILEAKTTIETAFDKAVIHDTNPIQKKYYIETPQLRWQNADPLKLCLIN